MDTYRVICQHLPSDWQRRPGRPRQTWLAIGHRTGRRFRTCCWPCIVEGNDSRRYAPSWCMLLLLLMMMMGLGLGPRPFLPRPLSPTVAYDTVYGSRPSVRFSLRLSGVFCRSRSANHKMFYVTYSTAIIFSCQTGANFRWIWVWKIYDVLLVWYGKRYKMGTFLQQSTNKTLHVSYRNMALLMTLSDH